MNERLKFVAAVERGDETVTQLCEDFGISRKTGYKLLRRYREEGPSALSDRSRAPRRHPNQTDRVTEAAVLRIRKAHPNWGSKKILAVLERRGTFDRLPARSTVDMILKRAGLVQPRKCRKRMNRWPGPPVLDAGAPNVVWSIDYKGWFRVGDGTRCDLLTVNDVYSRASLECRAFVAPKLEDVQWRLQSLFVRLGMPDYILSDNGPPFGSQGIAGLTRIGVWLLRLGIQPVFTEPGHPEQNGRHERFHRTLKAETANPPQATIREQQVAFDDFRRMYNDERPHEALSMATPSDFYEPSSREMPAGPPDHEYSEAFTSRRVRKDGSLWWKRGTVFLGEALANEVVGVEEIGEDRQIVHLGPMRLGVIHERTRTIVPMPVGEIGRATNDTKKSGKEPQ